MSSSFKLFLQIFRFFLPIYCLFVILGTVLAHEFIDHEKPNPNSIGLLAAMHQEIFIKKREFSLGARTFSLYYFDLDARQMVLKEIQVSKDNITKRKSTVKRLINSDLLVMVLFFIVSIGIITHWIIMRKAK